MDDERELIKMILRYIGVLHDVKATEKSIAAGGRDSVKDSETGVSDINGSYKATTTAELKAKIAQLTELIQTTKTPGAFQKLALLHLKTSKLAVYAGLCTHALAYACTHVHSYMSRMHARMFTRTCRVRMNACSLVHVCQVRMYRVSALKLPTT